MQQYIVTERELYTIAVSEEDVTAAAPPVSVYSEVDWRAVVEEYGSVEVFCDAMEVVDARESDGIAIV